MRTLSIWIVLVLIFFAFFPPNQPAPKSTPKSTVTQTPSPTPAQPGYSVFVPHWQIPDSSFTLTSPVGQKTNPTASIYFSVTPDKNAHITQNSAHKRISTFIERAPKPHMLTIAMTQEDITTPILRDRQLQKKLIAEALDLAHTHDFEGIVLDLEHSVLPFKEVRSSITQFIAFFQKAHAKTTCHSTSLYTAIPIIAHDPTMWLT